MAEVIKMPGTVRSVNGIKPDENANVDIGENVKYFSCMTTSTASRISNVTDDDGKEWIEVEVKIPPLLDSVDNISDVLIDRCFSKTILVRMPPQHESWSVDVEGWGGDNYKEHVISIKKGHRESESTYPLGHKSYDNDLVTIRYAGSIDGIDIVSINALHNLILAYVPKKNS